MYIDIPDLTSYSQANAEHWAMQQVKREFEQGFQGIEMKLNTVGSSRGDYPFITMTFGLDTSEFGKMAAKTFLRVHMNGQGKPGNKKPVLFPKLVFLYDENLHGPGCVNEDVFEAGIACSCNTMYPDWLSLTGDGYVAEIYKKYGRVVHPMGCRAFLSPWFERGGMTPADENDKPVYVGRFNVGAVCGLDTIPNSCHRRFNAIENRSRSGLETVPQRSQRGLDSIPGRTFIIDLLRNRFWVRENILKCAQFTPTFRQNLRRKISRFLFSQEVYYFSVCI